MLITTGKSAVTSNKITVEDHSIHVLHSRLQRQEEGDKKAIEVDLEDKLPNIKDDIIWQENPDFEDVEDKELEAI